MMTQAGKELERITVYVYNKMQFELSTSITVSGSMLCSVSEAYAEFKKCCEESAGEVTFVSQAEMAAKGTYYLLKEIYIKVQIAE